MHVQHCCFAYSTYCFFHVLVVVAVVASKKGPYETTAATATANIKKAIDLVAKQQLCTCITLFCTFLYRPCTITT